MLDVECHRRLKACLGHARNRKEPQFTTNPACSADQVTNQKQFFFLQHFQ